MDLGAGDDTFAFAVGHAGAASPTSTRVVPLSLSVAAGDGNDHAAITIANIALSDTMTMALDMGAGDGALAEQVMSALEAKGRIKNVSLYLIEKSAGAREAARRRPTCLWCSRPE